MKERERKTPKMSKIKSLFSGEPEENGFSIKVRADKALPFYNNSFFQTKIEGLVKKGKNEFYKLKAERLPEGTIMTSPLKDMPEIKQGDDIGSLILDSLQSNKMRVENNDIFVIASKIISKAEGRRINYSDVVVTSRAIEIFNAIKRKSPEQIQVILDNTKEEPIVRNRTIISRNKDLGIISTAAGVDNIDGKSAMLLPKDPDLSAKKIMEKIKKETGKDVGVIISDSEGREDRKGAGAISIGVAGIDPLRVKEVELEGGKTKKTEETVCDMLASMGALSLGQAGNNIPVVRIRGFEFKHNKDANFQSIIN